jgi:hypothetical protein
LQREEFQVDKESYDYKLRHPVLSKSQVEEATARRGRVDSDDDDDLRNRTVGDVLASGVSDDDGQFGGDLDSDVDMYEAPQKPKKTQQKQNFKKRKNKSR